MGFSGRLEGIAPSDILQVISQNRMTGTLIARCPDRTAMVVFKDGQVMEATSDAPQESLAYLLVSQGFVNEATIETAREHLKQEPERSLGAILVQMGAITAKDLEAVVFRQIGHIVHRLMSCDDGFLTFDRGEMAVKRKLNTREFFLPSGVSAEYLIMERARVVDEERRHKPDRRAQARVPDPIGVPAGNAAESPGRTGAPAAVAALSSWFSAIKFPKMAGLQNAAASVTRKGKEFALTAVQKGKQIAASASDKFQQTVAPKLENALGKARAFSPDGRAMLFAGIAAAAAGIALIVLFTLSFPAAGGGLVITGKVVKLRAQPTTNAKVVVKIPQGEKVSQIEFKDGWHHVKTKAGETGWVWKNLVEQQANKGWAFKYRVTGFELMLLAGLALIAVGVMRRRRTASPSPGLARETR